MNLDRVKILNQLRDYQLEAVLKTEKSSLGKIILPTGTGKTYCQAAQLALDITSNSGFRAYVVNAPRIVLTYQLLKEHYKFLTLLGVPAKYMFVHSGGQTDEKELEDIRIQSNMDGNSIPYAGITSTISTQTIIENIYTAQKLDVPLVIVSTYHSFNKIYYAFKSADTKIDMIINDEAHHLVQDKFNDELRRMVADKIYFYTATEKDTPSSDGRGMNNSDLFGETIVNMTPREAILKGLMVPPRLHFVRPEGEPGYSEEEYDRSRNRIIYEAFTQHKELLSIPAKLLVSTKGSKDIKEFIDSEFCTELQEQGTNVFAVASHEDIGNYVNSKYTNRQDFLAQLKIIGDSKEDMLVLHYDILTEGIDIPGFTGVMPMRALSMTKFRQTYGRPARRLKSDFIKIQEGTVKFSEYDKLEKPYAWVILPYITQNQSDNREYIKSLIKELRDYESNPKELILDSGIINALTEEEELEGLNQLDKRLTTVAEIIKELEAEIEDEKFSNLIGPELVKLILNT